MAGDTGHEKVILNSEKLTLFNFAQSYSNQFPLIVSIDRDYRGILRFLPAKKLLLVSHIVGQRRLILKSKSHGLVSIPEIFPTLMERSNVFGRVVKRELVGEYMQQLNMDKSQKIRFTMPFDEFLVSEGAPVRSQDLGPMNFSHVDSQQYLVVHPLDNDKIEFNPMAIPLAAQLEVRLVEGHREMSSHQWFFLMDECKLALQQISETKPPELEKVIVSFNGASTMKSRKNIQSSYSNRSYHQPMQQQQLHSSTKRHGEAEANNQRLNQGFRNMRLAGAAERHVTIVAQDDMKAESGIKQGTTSVKSPALVNFRDPASNYYNQYYTKNEPTNLNANNNFKTVANQPFYRMGHPGVVIQTGQPRLNIDQKGPRIQSKSSVKLDNRLETRMISLGEPRQSEISGNHQRIAVMGRPNQQNQQYKANGVERGRTMKSYDSNNNYGNLERTASQVLFMDITCSEDESGSDETIRDSKHSKTFDHPSERLLQVPNVQYGHVNSRQRIRKGKNSKSLSDLRFDRLTTERPRAAMKEESDDADIENESQITVIRGKPVGFDSRMMVQTSNKNNPRIVPTQDVVDKSNSGIRYTENSMRTINGGNHKVIPRTSDGNKHPHFITAKEAYLSRISGQESDTSNLYLRYKRPTFKKYPRRFKYSSDADFSGSEDMPRQKVIPYDYTDTGYFPRMRIKTSKNYNNSASDLDTVARRRMSYVNNYTVGDSHQSVVSNIRNNRLSSSSIFLEPVEESHMYRRNIVHGAMDSRHRTRSSPAKVLMVNRQGQVSSRDVQTNYFPSPHGPSNHGQPGPMSRTLISLKNGVNHPSYQVKRSIRDHPQGVYRQVINLR